MSAPRKLASGTWRIRWIDARGARQSATFTSEGAAKVALRRAQSEADDVRAGRTRPRSDQTVADAAPAWLAARPPSRQADNRAHLDQHVLPFLGSKRLPEITPALVERFIRHLESKRTARHGERNEAGRTLRPASIANVLITLRKMMGDLDYPIRIRYKVPTSGYSWLKSAADVARFLAATDGWFRMACELAVYAGLRFGEVAGLRWGAVDFDRGMLRVDRSYDGPTKSKHARWIPLAPELADSLRRYRLAHGAGERVITDAGRPLERHEGDTAGRARRACKRAGVEPITFHALRHTYASHLAERVSLPIVGAVLGHADPKTTARYSHVSTEALAHDVRLHLSFARPDAPVIPLRGQEPDLAGHVVATPRAATSRPSNSR